MRNYLFTTKEQYLQYREDWKEEYKQLSLDIREMKEDIRNLQRERSSTAGIYQSSRESYRKQATLILAELKEAKIKAQEQYLAAKALQVST